MFLHHLRLLQTVLDRAVGLDRAVMFLACKIQAGVGKSSWWVNLLFDLWNFLFLCMSLCLYVEVCKSLYTIAPQNDISNETGIDHCYTQKDITYSYVKQLFLNNMWLLTCAPLYSHGSAPWRAGLPLFKSTIPCMEFCPFIAELSPGKDWTSTIHLTSIWELTAVQWGGKKQ